MRTRIAFRDENYVPAFNDAGVNGASDPSLWTRLLASDAGSFARRIWLIWMSAQVIGFGALCSCFPYNRATPSDSDIYLYWTWSSAVWHGAIPYHTRLPMPIVYPPGILPVLGLPSFSF